VQGQFQRAADIRCTATAKQLDAVCLRRRAAQEDGLDGSSPRIMRRARPQSPFLVGLSRETDTRDHSSTSADAPPPPSLVKILIAAHS
jgi:hypothetical protein